ncbi:putative serine/threonine-protein kinase [Planomonospora parontospora subsp. parontospora]|uniref:non-specific serine/threonine protein kinase n=2 Tax=Planomonospora parontospora TaxID=58119 RepID=A0AA37BF52_9ACTN|nr:Stk1 family PASTA domain-containing Ser/Thr kinase [Planomonospora parontospora]GGK61481.1 putative serine/threonine-protein kinase [Planomonospora parontospora]GII08655.1 putative serine/threonine-protein kinase [Planomonospora parontospora subsp. parontospora]
MTQPRRLGDRYELDGVVGRGGMAEVYRARDIRLDRIVAIKTLRADLARDHTFQARFRREAQSAASLNHPSIVAVYDTGEDTSEGAPVPYIVMEYVDGSTLRDILRADRRLLPERAAELVDGILRALDYSHRGGIVHRDIKPANIMITRNGDVKVMDFGIARAMADSAATMTQTAQVIGTAQYLSPEQARGERVDARSDIYSTGCVLYELLTGQPPFTGDSPVAIAYQHVREDPIPPSQIDPEIPAWADAIVLKAMAKDPAHRYQSAGEMRADIQRALQGMPMDAQTMALANNYGAATRTMQQQPGPGGPVTQRTTAVPAYEYGTEDGAGRGERGRRRAQGGGNTALKTAAWILIPLLIIGAFIGVGYTFLSAPGTPTGDGKVEIPALASQTVEAATKQLGALGLKVKTTEEFSEEQPKGAVIETDPAAGAKVDKNTEVKVVVSKGVERVTVPDVVGKTVEEATAELEGKGFEVTVVTKASSRPQGVVLESDPEAGKKAAKGGTVRIYIPKEAVEVPDVTGYTVGDATKALKDAGFKVKTVEQPSDQAEGTVLSQSPGSGAKIQPGTTITLTVSSGQPPMPTAEPTQPTDDPSLPSDEPTDDQPDVPSDEPTDDPFFDSPDGEHG